MGILGGRVADVFGWRWEVRRRGRGGTIQFSFGGSNAQFYLDGGTVLFAFGAGAGFRRGRDVVFVV
jgi:hypothetical protein